MKSKNTLLLEQAYEETNWNMMLKRMIAEGKNYEEIENFFLTEAPAWWDKAKSAAAGLVNVGQGVISTAKQAGQGLATAAKRAAGAVVGGAQQIGKNVAAQYKTGKEAATAQQKVVELKKKYEEFKSLTDDLNTRVTELYPSLFPKGIKGLSIAAVMSKITGQMGTPVKQAAAASNTAASTAQQGMFKGVGSAMAAGAKAATTPPPVTP